jgi:hypothetical protein
MEQAKSTSFIGSIVDMPLDKFKDSYNTSNRTQNDLKILHDILVKAYQATTFQKDKVFKLKITKEAKGDKKDLDRIKRCLSNLYSYLQVIENKVVFLDSLIKK